MEQIWLDPPHVTFLRDLRMARTKELLADRPRLALLRYDYKSLSMFARSYKSCLQDLGVDLFEEVYQASIPRPADEEKACEPPPRKRLAPFKLPACFLPPDLVQLILTFHEEQKPPPNTLADAIVPEYDLNGLYGSLPQPCVRVV